MFEGPLFDATATRAATGAQIRNAGSPDICFDVSDFRAGDFRFNLVPLALKKCDASVDGQKFDLITKVIVFLGIFDRCIIDPVTGSTQQRAGRQPDVDCVQSAIHLC